jgi:catechol 2,3-dioxygenase-like lactoylglutathione lyase family enzyme
VPGAAARSEEESEVAGDARAAEFAISGLAEVVLNVHDLDAALGFYRDMLGLKVISPPEMTSPVFLRAGEAMAGLPAMLVLVRLPPDAVPFAPPRTLHHLALAIAPAGFDAAERALTAAGHAVRTGKHPVIPSRTMYVDDPDGNEVELITPL